MKYVIFPNLTKPAAHRTALAVCEKLRGLSGEIIMDEALRQQFDAVGYIRFLPEDTVLQDADFVIAIGGDGTILRYARMILRDAAAHHKTPVPLVGINTGTLGFLAAFESDELDMLERLETGDYTRSERMLLQAELPDSAGIQTDVGCIALNDIYASRMNGKICDFSVAVDGQQIGVFRADGIIFSTPTGSSAYALSAGGPVMEPDLALIEMNLICPHSLFARPMLFAPTRSIRVTYRGAGNGGLRVHTDGAETAILRNTQSFTVRRADHSIPFITCKGQTFYDVLSGKLMRPLKA
ncbi:MAG: NAD(+)/NADH kinase [Oscillospiraceae bacterium]|nr:NAD(+)/NADH kinase [Oscillospiraceae bacterium]